MRNLFFGTSIFLLFLLSSCSDGYKEHESGLKYMIITENPENKMPIAGDILVLDLTYKTETDSLLFSTKEIQGQYRMKMNTPSHSGGCIEDAFGLMHIGDSIQVKIDAHNFYANTRKIDVPDFIQSGDQLIFDIKLVKIFDIKEWEEEKNKLRIADEKQEESFLEAYLKRTSTKVEPTESGLYYVEMEPGTGRQPQANDLVELHYLAMFVDGYPYKNSYETGQTVKFRIDNNEVIKGWDEGIKLMNEGGKSRLVIPSKLAYGDKQYGDVPPYSTLIFEIELISVKPLN